MSFQQCENYEFGMQPRARNRQQDIQQQVLYSSPRDAENINEIRKLIREQSNITNKTNVIRYRSSNSDSSEEIDIEVAVRRFTPLPDIPRVDDIYYRTEGRLIKDKEIDMIDENSDISLENQNCDTNYNYLVGNNFEMDDQLFKSSSFNNLNYKKETRYHFGFASTNGNNKVNYNQRLPALEKQINHSLPNAMDLDEDLPISNEQCTYNQRMIYTSPGDRMISPIKRPQAPSPAASAYRRKANKNSDSDSDIDIIIS